MKQPKKDWGVLIDIAAGIIVFLFMLLLWSTAKAEKWID